MHRGERYRTGRIFRRSRHHVIVATRSAAAGAVRVQHPRPRRRQHGQVTTVADQNERVPMRMMRSAGAANKTGTRAPRGFRVRAGGPRYVHGQRTDRPADRLRLDRDRRRRHRPEGVTVVISISMPAARRNGGDGAPDGANWTWPPVVVVTNTFDAEVARLCWCRFGVATFW